MTSEEIASLQMGDAIMFLNGAYAEVQSTNNVDRTISLHMLSGSSTVVVGSVPPAQQDVLTLCVCLWADLANAEKSSGIHIQPNKAESPLIEPRFAEPAFLITPANTPVVDTKAVVSPRDYNPQIPGSFNDSITSTVPVPKEGSGTTPPIVITP